MAGLVADLAHEFALTTDGVTPLVVERLRRLGIPDRVIYGPRHLVGVDRIVNHSSGLFEFHEDGDLALIVAEGEPEVPGWADVYDLIAFKPETPSRWWLRRNSMWSSSKAWVGRRSMQRGLAKRWRSLNWPPSR